MPITANNLIGAGSAASQNSYTTASYTPTTDRIVLIAVSNPRGAGSPNTPTISGNSMTWTQIRTFLDASASLRRLTVFRGVATAPSTGTIVINFAGQSQDSCMWSITEYDGTDTTGTNGSNAIVQSVTGEANGTSTGVTATLAAFSNVNNATYGVVRHNSNGLAITQGSGFTEINEISITNNRSQTEFKDTNDTTVDWSWSSTSLNATAIAIELKSLIAAPEPSNFFLLF